MRLVWWCRWRAGWWLPGIGGSHTGCWIAAAWPLRRPGPISGICRRRGGRRRRSGRMVWICCAGSGSCGRRRWPGNRRPGPRPGSFAGGWWWPVSRPARIGGSSGWDRMSLRSRRGGRAHAHHNPMEPFRRERSGLYRPVVPSRIPRNVPDEEFNAIFAALGSHRDRALVAFYVSTGARASELLSATRGGVDPGRQLITVVRKGTRAVQPLPASADAFVWLRLYQVEMDGLLPRGGGLPLWWTLRRPFRPLGYHAVHRMFERAGAVAGTDATLHSLRHTAAYRLAADPALPLTDVQFVLGHALLTTTQLYLTQPS